jgi:hypothetical protein
MKAISTTVVPERRRIVRRNRMFDLQKRTENRDVRPDLDSLSVEV